MKKLSNENMEVVSGGKHIMHISAGGGGPVVRLGGTGRAPRSQSKGSMGKESSTNKRAGRNVQGRNGYQA